jgi:4-amino-4-deoxy-L-arabinose transferase-like glycosyltransferase
MIDTARSVEGTVETPIPPLISSKTPARSPWWHHLGLIGVMLVSLFMNFYQLGQNGFGNAFYAAGVRSMLDGWHNFFFVSYDPGGFVTLDKPPLGFWLQVISARIFGFTAFSVYLPQALAGILSVWILYRLVRRHFGVVAGLLAALALALSPISVVTNRNNTIDSILTLVMLLGAWAVIKAAETGKLRWLLLCAVAIGLGFNIKTLEAYLVLPAFGLLYLLAAPRKVWTRILHLALASLLLLTISLSWAVAVDLTPASQRPYVGSSQNNSEISLALGYNGIDRLIGGIGLPGSHGSQPASGSSTSKSGTQQSSTSQASSTTTSSSTNALPGSPDGVPPTREGGASGPANGGGFGGFNIGTAGPFRLFSEGLGGQIAWLLPFAILGMLAVAWRKKPQIREDKQLQSLIVWGTWLITMGIFFSVASFFHQYYLTIMAPAICALFGIGAVVMWRDYRATGWRGWLLPVAMVATAATQIYILNSYPAWSQWLSPIIAGLSGLAVLALVIVRLVRHNTKYERLVKSAFYAGMLVLLLAPAVWSTISIIQNNQSSLPVAGPAQTMGFGGGQGNNSNSEAKLISYLESHQGNAKYLVATISSQEADQIILDTNKPVMAMGGFSGSDPILTVSKLESLVQSGQVRYFLISSGGMGGSGQQSALVSWIKSHSTVVPTSQWQSSSSSSVSHGFGGEEQLYEYSATK